MFDILPTITFNFNFKGLFSSGKKQNHELQYKDFLKSIENLEKDNKIDLLCQKLLNGKFDLLFLVKDTVEVIKMIGKFDVKTIQKFKVISIPLLKNGEVKYTLNLGFKDPETKYKLRYDFIELLNSYLD